MKNSENAIEIRNMYKKFKVSYDRPNTLKERLLFWKHSKAEWHGVLKDINIDIKKGETVALIGTNGCGKSTLLKLMTKILYPSQGTLKTNGKLTSLLELGAGFHPDFTGRENIYFNASIFGLTKSEIDKRIDTIIEFSELHEFIDNPIRTYSSGMYMRLAFSIAINVDAQILLIDEILAVGDQHFQDKCFDKLEELKDSDKTIVIVSHSLDVVEKLCSRAIWIYKGEFKLDGDPTYVIGEYLKQVKADNQEKARLEPIVKKEKYKGVIFLDTPKPFADISVTGENILIAGWELNDCYNSSIEISVDGKAIENISRNERPDVLMTYEEQYGGYATNDKVGFTVLIIPSNYELGEHRIQVNTKDENGKIISNKEIKVEIK